MDPLPEDWPEEMVGVEACLRAFVEEHAEDGTLSFFPDPVASVAGRRKVLRDLRWGIGEWRVRPEDDTFVASFDVHWLSAYLISMRREGDRYVVVSYGMLRGHPANM